MPHAMMCLGNLALPCGRPILRHVGITTLTRLVQLQTTDLQDPAGPSWAQGLLDSLNPLLHEHPSDTTGSCPKVMACLLEGRLRCVVHASVARWIRTEINRNLNFSKT